MSAHASVQYSARPEDKGVITGALLRRSWFSLVAPVGALTLSVGGALPAAAAESSGAAAPAGTAAAQGGAEHALHLPEVVLLFSGLLLVASLAAVGLKRLRLPFTVALVLLGVGLHQLSQIPQFGALGTLRLSPELTIFVLVPALLFEASFNIDSRRLMDNLWPILVLAVPVLLVSTAVVGALLSIFGGVPLHYALVFGALISATDPVAVLAIFKEVGAPKRLAMLVDGESLANDGTALVVFKLLLGLALAGAGGLEVVPGAALEFARVFAGGTVVGLATGWLASQLLARIHHESVVELSISLVLAYATFSLADHVFKVSGVIATVTAGIVIGNYGRTKISPQVLPHMEHFWEYLGFVANALIFLLVGLSIDFTQLAQLGGMLALAIIAVLVARALPIFALIPLTNRAIREPISRAYQVVLFWGGLRGALALAMALSLPIEFPARDLFIGLTFGVVLFTLLVGGPTTAPVLRRLGLMQDSREEAIERQTGLALVARTVDAKLEQLRAHGAVSDGVVREVAAQLHASESDLKAALEAARARERFTSVEEERLLRRHALLLEMRAASALYEEGDISEGALKELHHQTQAQLDALRWEGWEAAHHHVHLPHPAPWNGLLVTVRRAAARLPLADAWVRAHEVHRTEREYEVRRARLLVTDAVLRELAEIEAAHVSDGVIALVEDRYRLQRQIAEGRLLEMAERHPAFCDHAQRVIARRFYLRAEQEALSYLAGAGLISERVVREEAEEIEAELARLRSRHFGGAAAPTPQAQPAGTAR